MLNENLVEQMREHEHVFDGIGAVIEVVGKQEGRLGAGD